MNLSRTIKYTVSFCLFALMLFGVGATLKPASQCLINMVYIPSGTFGVGTTEKEFRYINRLCELTVGGCYESWFEQEMPYRKVRHRPFCIDRYEYPNKKGRYPQSGVSFGHAKQICESQGKRLCTEIEWERACIAGTMRYAWSFGNEFQEHACNINTEEIAPSGAFPYCRSLEGVFDMNGNVSEWVSDELSEYQSGEMQDYRILKGGSFRDRAVFTRCNYVDSRSPESDYQEFGFRCCTEITDYKPSNIQMSVQEQ